MHETIEEKEVVNDKKILLYIGYFNSVIQQLIQTTKFRSRQLEKRLQQKQQNSEKFRDYQIKIYQMCNELIQKNKETVEQEFSELSLSTIAFEMGRNVLGEIAMLNTVVEYIRKQISIIGLLLRNIFLKEVVLLSICSTNL